MPKLSPLTNKLIKEYSRSEKKTSGKEDVIGVDEITVRVASFYEKIRGIIDWKGEHLLKRNAIERIIKRRIVSSITLGEKISSIPAKPLVTDLIRSGHFENNKIQLSRISEVQEALDKYVYIINNLSLAKDQQSFSFYYWLSSVAACEIEEILSRSTKERALISYMYNSMKEAVETDGEISEKEKNILFYIAVQKALFDLDPPIISYHILKYEYKNWENPSKEDLKKITKTILYTKKRIDFFLEHPFLKKFYQLCRVYNTPYLLIGDVLKEDPKKGEEILSDPQKAEKEIEKHYEKRAKSMKGRLSRAAIYATLSIFITNVAALLVVEIPFSHYINIGEFTLLVVAIDVLLPTFLMVFLVVTISPPPERNKRKVVFETMKTLYQSEEIEKHKIKTPKSKKTFLYYLVSLLYMISFLVSVGVIVWLLSLINFPLLSYFIFIIFLSLIAFAGTKIRERAKELHMIEEKEGFVHVIMDIFALPMLQLGKWLTIRWKKYNIIAVFFSALIDMPFNLFIEFLDQWRKFLREKKEEIY